MGLSLPYPELVDRDTTTPGMRHIAKTMSVYACGEPRDPTQPLRTADLEAFDCVVCVDLWLAVGPWDVPS